MSAFSPAAYGSLVGLIRETLAGAGALAGRPGREIELRANETHIQWRYAGASDDWTDLIKIPLAAKYTHDQTTAKDVWHIQHNIGKWPVDIIAVDSDGEQIIGRIDVVESTQNLLVYRFSEPLSGSAYIN